MEQAVRNVQAQFSSLQEQLYGRAHDLRAHMDQRLAALTYCFLAHQQATERLIRGLHDQFQAEFYQNHTSGMQSLRGMLEQLLADRTQSTAPIAIPSLAPTAQSAPAHFAPPQEAYLLSMDVPAVPPSTSSGAHLPTESRTVVIPTHGAVSGHRTPRMSRAMAPHNSWMAASHQDPPQPAPQPAPSVS